MDLFSSTGIPRFRQHRIMYRRASSEEYMKKGRMRLILYRAISAVLTAMLGIYLFGLAEAHYHREQAERLLTVIQQLKVGVTDRATAFRLTAPFVKRSHHFMYGELPAVDFRFDNRGLFRLWLAPYVDFHAFVVFNGNILVEKHLREYTTACGCAVEINEIKRGFGFPGDTVPKEYPNHTVRRGWYSPTHVQHLFVDDDDTYPPAQLQADWHLNLSCLTRIGGCWDARIFLPGIEPTPEVSESAHSGLN